MTIDIEAAVAALRAGELVIFPTETVYGLGCDAADPKAVARLYAAKGRPSFNPLIAHVAGLEEAQREANLSPQALKLAERFWPGPLTLVAPRRDDARVCELACAGLATVALRAPNHAVAQALLRAFGGPIVAPSANLSGRLSTTAATDAAADLGERVRIVLDAGPSPIGIESTIVSVGADGRATLLRPGAIARAEIESITGPLQAPTRGVEAPGMLESHYAPRARLRLDADAPLPGEAFLAFGAPAPAGGLTLSASGDLIEAAANLYACLRALDAGGAATIAVAPIPAVSLGEAIRDRLARAAAPR